MTDLRKWAAEHGDRAPGSWLDATARLREALGHAPGSAGRDDLLGRFFALAESTRLC